MQIRIRRGSVLVGGAATLAVLAFAAVAQAQDTGDPYQVNMHINTGASPYWGYVYSPYGDIIRAEGDFLIKRQVANLLREKLRDLRLKRRRREMEQAAWEREFKYHEMRKEREHVARREIEYAQDDPAPGEIISGEPLNRLYRELARRTGPDSKDSVRLDPEWVTHINFVGVAGDGNVGLLKTAVLYWPQLLQRHEFAEETSRLKELLAAATRQVRAGGPANTEELERRLGECQARLRKELFRHGQSRSEDPAWNYRHYTDAQRFLRQLNDAVVVMEKPDAAFYFAPPRANTVAELVLYMKNKGVKFAAATDGGERAYVSLRSAFADEWARLQPPSGSRNRPSTDP